MLVPVLCGHNNAVPKHSSYLSLGDVGRPVCCWNAWAACLFVRIFFFFWLAVLRLPRYIGACMIGLAWSAGYLVVSSFLGLIAGLLFGAGVSAGSGPQSEGGKMVRRGMGW